MSNKPHAILTEIADGIIVGSRAALDRVKRSNVIVPLGTNGHGDHVYNLGRLPLESREKYLYLTPFTRTTPSGAMFRAYVAIAP